MLKRAAALTLCAAMLLNIGCSEPGFVSDARADAISDINIDDEENAEYGALLAPGAGATSYAMAYAEAFAKYLTNNNFCLYIEDELIQRRAMELIDGVIGAEKGGGVLTVADDSCADDLVKFVGEYDPTLIDKFNADWTALIAADNAGDADGKGKLAFLSPGAYSKAYAQAAASAYAAFLCSNTVNIYVNGKPEITAEPAEAARAQDGQQELEGAMQKIQQSLPADPDMPVRSMLSPGANTREYSSALARATASFFSGNTIHIYLDGTKNPNAPAPEFTSAMVHALECKPAKLKNAAAFTVTASGFTSDFDQAPRALFGLVLALADSGVEARVCSLTASAASPAAEAVIAVDKSQAEAVQAVFEGWLADCVARIGGILPEFTMTLAEAEPPKKALSAENSLCAANLAYSLFAGADGAVFTDCAAFVTEAEVSFTTVIGSGTEPQLAEAERLLRAQASLAGFETSFG